MSQEFHLALLPPASRGRVTRGACRSRRCLCRYLAGPRLPIRFGGPSLSTDAPIKQRPRIAGPSLQTSDLPPKMLSCVSFLQDARNLSRNRCSDGFETVRGPNGAQGVGGPPRPPTLSALVQCCVQE